MFTLSKQNKKLQVFILDFFHITTAPFSSLLSKGVHLDTDSETVYTS